MVALFDSLNYLKQEEARERQDALLGELSNLRKTFPEDVTVRVWFARALYNVLLEANQKGAFERHAALLLELKKLLNAFPEDPDLNDLRDRLAEAL